MTESRQVITYRTGGSLETKALLLCLLLSLLTQLVASNDSPLTHGLNAHIDSSWFLTAGRALMNGMTPYVDFTDSKGPLLWLFYGVGYLLDPRGWWGVFAMYVLLYTGVYYYFWKGALLLTRTGREAACVVIAGVAIYFLPPHLEMRAEDVAQLPLVYNIYLALRSFAGKGVSRRQMFWSGVAISSALFIKWNFPVMFVSLPVAVLLNEAVVSGHGQSAAGTRKKVLSLGAIWLAGFAALSAAVLLWMWFAGALQAFFDEYFFATLKTAGSKAELFRTLLMVLGNIVNRSEKWVLLMLVCVAAVSVYRFGRRGLLLAAAYVWMVVLVHLHMMLYYITLLSSWFLFCPAAVLVLGHKLFARRSFALPAWTPYAASGMLMALLCFTVWFKHENVVTSHAATVYEDVADRVAAHHRPLIIYLNNGDLGVGVRAEALPGCKYWATQLGSTQAMRQDQIEAMRAGRPDIVVADSADMRPLEYGYVTRPSDVFPMPYSGYQSLRFYWHPRCFTSESPGKRASQTPSY